MFLLKLFLGLFVTIIGGVIYSFNTFPQLYLGIAAWEIGLIFLEYFLETSFGFFLVGIQYPAVVTYMLIMDSLPAPEVTMYLVVMLTPAIIFWILFTCPYIRKAPDSNELPPYS